MNESQVSTINQKALMFAIAILPSERTNGLRENQSTRITSNSSRSFFLGRLVAMSISLSCLGVVADDWPQINGPNRNGVAVNETLQAQWPADGLKKVWSHAVGQGNAGPAIADDKLIIFHRPGKSYLVEALDPETGKQIWKKELPAEYTGGMDGDLGPKCVPLIQDGHVYLLGAGGKLFCLKFNDGSVVWQKNVLKEYRCQPGYFGVGSTPIVVDGKLILNAGGRNAAIVAFDAKSGKEAWKSFNDEASYSSPIEFKIDGQSVVVFVTRLNLVGLDPKSGKVLFQTPFGKSGPTVNGAMPVRVTLEGKEFLFVSAAYGVGAHWLEVSKDNVDEKWSNDTSFSSQYSTPVFADGGLFGTAGREDFKNGSYRCIDPSNGKVLWQQDDFPVGHSLLVGKQILVLDSSGSFHVIEADKSRFKQVYQTKLFESEARAMPAIANGLYYARSNSSRTRRGFGPPRSGPGQGKLVCVEVGKRKK
jgi:outer membrane protein assembly factor BamB